MDDKQLIEKEKRRTKKVSLNGPSIVFSEEDSNERIEVMKAVAQIVSNFHSNIVACDVADFSSKLYNSLMSELRKHRNLDRKSEENETEE